MNRLELPLSPGTNRMWRRSGHVIHHSDEYKEFKEATAQLARRYGLCEPIHGQVMVAITYHPKGRKKETEKPLRRLDCDAHIKPTLDALIGVAYLDDYQVVEVTCKLAEPTEKGALIVEWKAA